MKYFLNSIVFIASIFLNQIAFSAPIGIGEAIDHDWYTTVTNTGQDWVDTTLTSGYSRDQVWGGNGGTWDAMAPGGWAANGWRYATLTDIQSLFTSFNPDWVNGDSAYYLYRDPATGIEYTRNAINNQYYLDGVLFTGDKNTLVRVPYLGANEGMAAEMTQYFGNQSDTWVFGQTGRLLVSGFYERQYIDGSSEYSNAIVELRYMFDPNPAVYAIDHQIATDPVGAYQLSDYSNEIIGHFLVRDSNFAVVPTPATLPLSLSGLAGLACLHRRKALLRST